jgi:hypothetical protein
MGKTIEQVSSGYVMAKKGDTRRKVTYSEIRLPNGSKLYVAGNTVSATLDTIRKGVSV